MAFNEFKPTKQEQAQSFADTLRMKLAEASPELAGIVQGNKLVIDIGKLQDAQVAVVIAPNKSKIVSLTLKF
jgi:hypothetical protein